MRRFLIIVPIALALLSVSGIFAQDEPAGIPLQLVDSSPFGGEELALDDTITLYFDRSVDCDTARDAVSITPVVAGRLECDDASLQFVPDVGFDRATTYTLQVKDTLRAQDGGT